MKHKLDFNLLPKMDYAGILTTLDPEIEKKFNTIGKLPETLNRARGALMLFYGAKGHSESWRDEAYIRAGLNEFYSINESLKHEHKTAGLPGNALEIYHTSNPLLHLMLLMRHVNVHIQSSPATRYETTVIAHIDEPKEYTFTIAVIKNISIDQLLLKREVKKNYDIDQLNNAIDWLKKNQKVFGVREVFKKGTEVYCWELLSKY